MPANPQIDCTVYRQDLARRLETVHRLLHVTDPVSGSPTNIGKEARGLSIVLLFAAYENLLTGLCRGLLETAIRLRVSNRRLQPGLKRFIVYPHIQSAAASSEDQIWRRISANIIDVSSSSAVCTINSNVFPKDGSFMKSSQVILFCELFNLGDPGIVLREIWSRLDTIVIQRNNIAHGQLTPEEVGRNYSVSEFRRLVSLWEMRWGDFIDHVESRASNRDFFRVPR